MFLEQLEVLLTILVVTYMNDSGASLGDEKSTRSEEYTGCEQEDNNLFIESRNKKC